MRKILEVMRDQAPLDEILENYESFKSIPDQSQFAVIKIGGEILKGSGVKVFANDVAALAEAGLPVTVVHGAGPQLTRAFKDKNIDTPIVDGIRYTPREAWPVFSSTVNQVNAKLKSVMRKAGVEPSSYAFNNALLGSLSNPDNLASTFNIDVDTRPLIRAIAEGTIPVIGSIGRSLEPLSLPENNGLTSRSTTLSGYDSWPGCININADQAGGVVAAKLGVAKYVVLTEAGGVLDDSETIISTLDSEDIETMIDSGLIHSGMIPKVRSAVEAIRQGVGCAVITSPDNLLPELFSNAGRGTLIK